MLVDQSGALGAYQELARSARLWPLWTFMSWQDIRQRYRGSLLGPFWIAGGIAAASLGAGLLYSRVLKVQSHQLIPYVAVSIAIWTLISVTLMEACHSFTGPSALIRNAAFPRPIHVLRTLSRNVLVFAHSALVVAVVLWISHQRLGPEAGWALAGFGLLLVNLLWSSWLIGLLSARFRDVIQLTTYGLQFVGFITPIFWFPEMAGRHFALLVFNPFYHWLEVVRGPLLGRPPTPGNWVVSIGMAVAGCALALVTFKRFRHQIALWV